MPGRRCGSWGVGAALVALGALVASPGYAQGALFPRVASFEYPLAHARAAGIYGRVLRVERGESRFGSETEGEAGIGEAFPVVALGRGRIPINLGLEVGVAARFSLTDPKTSLVSADWSVGLHTTADAGDWRFNLRVFHESSHLGDEYAEVFEVERLDWSREVAAIWASRRLGYFTAHGSVSYTLVDKLAVAPGSVATAIDFRGRVGQLFGAKAHPIAGVFFEGVQYAKWKFTSTARVGIELDTGERMMAVSVIALDGLSTQRQFYRERSRYVGVELRFDL